tara:strand:+ start:1267 stop:1863 length:597 start_codon:yes stop_codon:yes gene_type:complete
MARTKKCKRLSSEGGRMLPPRPKTIKDLQEEADDMKHNLKLVTDQINAMQKAERVPQDGDIWCRKDNSTHRYLVICVYPTGAVEMKGGGNELMVSRTKFEKHYTLAVRGKNLMTEGKITIKECTFADWYVGNVNTLWIQEAEKVRIYMVEGEDDLSLEDDTHWEEYKANYLYFGNPEYGEIAPGELRNISKDWDIQVS